MAAKRPWIELPWHAPSDQPQRYADRRGRAAQRLVALPEYLRSFASVGIGAPLVALRTLSLLANTRPSSCRPSAFMGLAVSPDHGDEAVTLIRELGVRRILIRVPVWERRRFTDFRRFVDLLPECEVVVAVLQDRGSVCEPRQWSTDLRAIFSAFAGRTREFQIGHAPNRTKWGCLHLGDYFGLAEAAERLRGDHPELILAGPAIIDFEPQVALRSLINLRHFRFDVCSALLYVDRRGEPSARQYGWFDLRRKIAFQAGVAGCSPRMRPEDRSRLWITETNWPLAGSGQFSPTSKGECVDEETQARYLTDYYRIAYATGLVERVYWWQLIAPGYGLVDPRGRMRRRSAFQAFAKLLSGETPLL